MNIRTNSIVNKTGDGAVNLPNKTSLPTGSIFNVAGDINATGITTVGFLTAKNANISGIITATTFVGDGSGLQNVASVSASKSIALKLIISDPPLRC